MIPSIRPIKNEMLATEIVLPPPILIYAFLQKKYMKTALLNNAYYPSLLLDKSMNNYLFVSSIGIVQDYWLLQLVLM